MIFNLNSNSLAPYLSSNQKKILESGLSFHSVDLNEALAKIKEGKSFQEILFYSLKFTLEEKFFAALNDELKNETENLKERLIYAIYSEDDKSVGLCFYKSPTAALDHFIFDGQNIEIEQVITTQDSMMIAGILSAFPEVSYTKPQNLIINDNFSDIAFSDRRFYMEQILLSKRPSAGFFFLLEIGVLEKILPEVASGKNLSQNKYHKYDIFEHLVRSCDSMEVPDLVLRFAALLHDIGKVPTRRLKENGEATFYNHEIVSSHMLVPVMKRFGIPKTLGMKIKYYVRNHMFHYTDEWSDKAIRRFLRKVSREDLANLILLRKSDRIGSGKTNPFPKKLQSLIDHIDDVIMKDMELKVTDLEINGKDLMDLGLSEGPFMGKILNQLLDEVKNENTRNSHEDLILRARAIILDSEFALLVSPK